MPPVSQPQTRLFLWACSLRSRGWGWRVYAPRALSSSSIPPSWLMGQVLTAVERPGGKCRHILCAWHPARQMPEESVVAGETLRGGVKDLFAQQPGTLTTHKEFVPLLEGAADHTELSKTRAKWCRQLPQSPRRGYIAASSEGPMGLPSVRRIQNPSASDETLIQQSACAHQECLLLPETS